MKETFKTPIAVRELTNASTGRTVTIELAHPRERRAGEFYCAYRIRGIGRAAVGRAFGADSVQALQLAFEAVRIHLEPYAPTLEWCGTEGETGFPQYVPYAFGPDVREKLERILNREIERAAVRLGKRHSSTRS